MSGFASTIEPAKASEVNVGNNQTGKSGSLSVELENDEQISACWDRGSRC